MFDRVLNTPLRLCLELNIFIHLLFRVPCGDLTYEFPQLRRVEIVIIF